MVAVFWRLLGFLLSVSTLQRQQRTTVAAFSTSSQHRYGCNSLGIARSYSCSFSPSSCWKKLQAWNANDRPENLARRSLLTCPSIAPTCQSYVRSTALHLADQDLAPSIKSSQNSNRSLVLASMVSLLLVGLGTWKRQVILAFLHFVKDQWLLATLDRLSAAGLAGLIIYTLFFLVWEMTFGVTTPVETAAGMAFGPINGIVASGTGKLLGAWLSFCLARFAFKEKVHKQVQSNELLGLMEESIEENPFKVALLCRFSPLPEFVKNAGMGVMPVPQRWFIASLIVHGFSFTCLWTCMGAETARVVRGGAPSATLKAMLTGATWIGFGAPVMIGMWIKSLKDKQRERDQHLEQQDAEGSKNLEAADSKELI